MLHWAQVLRAPLRGEAKSYLFTVGPQGAVKINWDEWIVSGMTLSLFTRFFLHTHSITHTHSEHQLLSLYKSAKPPWWLLWPIRTENNMVGIRLLQSPLAGLQSTVKGRARTPESWPVSQLSLTPSQFLSSTPMPG